MTSKTVWMWILGILITTMGIALAIWSPVAFVFAIGIGVVLFIAFILAIDYIGEAIQKRRK
jgi:hypothetical protein